MITLDLLRWTNKPRGREMTSTKHLLYQNTIHTKHSVLHISWWSPIYFEQWTHSFCTMSPFILQNKPICFVPWTHYFAQCTNWFCTLNIRFARWTCIYCTMNPFILHNARNYLFLVCCIMILQTSMTRSYKLHINHRARSVQCNTNLHLKLYLICRGQIRHSNW